MHARTHTGVLCPVGHVLLQERAWSKRAQTRTLLLRIYQLPLWALTRLGLTDSGTVQSHCRPSDQPQQKSVSGPPPAREWASTLGTGEQPGTCREKCALWGHRPHGVRWTLGRDTKERVLGARLWPLAETCYLQPTAFSLHTHSPGLRSRARSGEPRTPSPFVPRLARG